MVDGSFHSLVYCLAYLPANLLPCQELRANGQEL